MLVSGIIHHTNKVERFHKESYGKKLICLSSSALGGDLFIRMCNDSNDSNDLNWNRVPKWYVELSYPFATQHQINLFFDATHLEKKGKN